MCNPAIIPVLQWVGAGLAVVGGVQAARAQKAAGEYQAQVDEQNAKVGRQQADQARQIGNMEEERQMRRVRAAVATQRAAQAANGLDVNSGTALDLQAETAGFGTADALTMRSNAIRQAWGFEVGAVNDINSASASRAAGSNAATGTMLTTAANAFSFVGGAAGGKGVKPTKTYNPGRLDKSGNRMTLVG